MNHLIDERGAFFFAMAISCLVGYCVGNARRKPCRSPRCPQRPIQYPWQ
jgi:hypothetical protein